MSLRTERLSNLEIDLYNFEEKEQIKCVIFHSFINIKNQ